MKKLIFQQQISSYSHSLSRIALSSITPLNRSEIESYFFCFQSLTKQRPRECSQSRSESRSFPPSVIAYLSRSEVRPATRGLDEEDSFFERPPPPPPPLPPPPSSQQSQTQVDQASSGLIKDEEVPVKVADILGTVQDHEGITSEELVG